MIPLKEMSVRGLTGRLKELVDAVVDPQLRFTNPERFAEAYAELMFLLDRYEEMLTRPHLVHNVGQRRMAYIKEILKGRPAA